MSEKCMRNSETCQYIPAGYCSPRCAGYTKRLTGTYKVAYQCPYDDNFLCRMDSPCVECPYFTVYQAARDYEQAAIGYAQECYTEICNKADLFGVESLTENEQALLEGSITYLKFAKLEGVY